MAKHKKNPPRPDNSRQWRAHLKKQKESGMSRAAYCRQHNLSYHAMTYWHKKLARQSSSAVTLVQVPSLIPGVTAEQRRKGSGVRIVTDRGLSIELDDNFSSVTLEKVLTVIGGR